MRVLIAPDGFGGTLSAAEAAAAMAAGWRGADPDVDLDLLPMSDGGPGFVGITHSALGGELVPMVVTGPLGEPVPAEYLLVATDPGPVAYLESAHAVGLHLIPGDRRDPTRTTSYGVGELIGDAVRRGARRVVVGLGGSGTNDGGAGMLAGLGLDAGVLRSGGAALDALTAADLAGLPALRARLTEVDLIVACDVDVPLLGLHGASAGFSPQKGATAEQAQALERALGNFAHAVGQVLTTSGAARGLALADDSADPRGLPRLPGAGAAGGLGFGLAALGGRLLPGSAVVADAVGLGERVAWADLVVTGEGKFDWQSLHGKVVAAVAARASEAATPVIVIAGQTQVARREWSAAGIAGVYAVAERPDEIQASMADPARALAARCGPVARTWSR